MPKAKNKPLNWPNGRDPVAIRQFLADARKSMTPGEVAEYDETGVLIAEVLRKHGLDPSTKLPQSPRFEIPCEE